jgi:hypothetical protein
MKRFGSAAWNGGLREGKGSVSTESRALETEAHAFLSPQPYGPRFPAGIRPRDLMRLVAEGEGRLTSAAKGYSSSPPTLSTVLPRRVRHPIVRGCCGRRLWSVPFLKT